MDYVSTVVKKTSAVLQTERNIIIHRRKKDTYRTPIRSVLQRLASLYTLFELPFLGCLGGVMVKGVRHCSAGRARRIRGFNPHRRTTLKIATRTLSIYPTKKETHRLELFNSQTDHKG